MTEFTAPAPKPVSGRDPVKEGEMNICTEADCNRPVLARRLCKAHYERKRLAGELANVRPYDAGLSIEDRLARNQEVTEGGCVVWTKGKFHNGYGKIRYEGRSRTVHRVAWEIAHGTPPDDMVLNHICGNPACFNLDHLELLERSGNSAYRTHAPRAKSGYRNVRLLPNGRYQCRVTHKGRTYGGTWATAEEAHAQAKALRLELFGFEDYEDRWPNG